MKRKELPEPECLLGYTDSQLHDIMGSRYQEFSDWMSGQTMSICDGQAYDYEVDAYRNTGCGPHGVVVYYNDVLRFVLGLPVVD